MIPALVLSFAALAPRPAGFVIDSGAWQGVAVTEVRGKLVAADGSDHSFAVEVQPDATASKIHDAFLVAILGGGWRVRNGGPAVLLVEGTARSPVRSVELRTEQWVPTVRPVFAPPAKP